MIIEVTKPNWWDRIQESSKRNQQDKKRSEEERNFWENLPKKLRKYAKNKEEKSPAWQAKLTWKKIKTIFCEEEFHKFLWMAIHYFKPSIQWDWFRETELCKAYQKRICRIDTDLTELKNPEIFTTYLKKLDTIEHKNFSREDRWVVNLGPGTTEIRLIWFTLGFRGNFPIHCFWREERPDNEKVKGDPHLAYCPKGIFYKSSPLRFQNV